MPDYQTDEVLARARMLANELSGLPLDKAICLLASALCKEYLRGFDCASAVALATLGEDRQ